jgi:hypothetical protein
MYYSLTEENVEEVADAVKAFYAAH